MTWAEYVEAVKDHLPLDGERRGTERAFLRYLKNSIIDLQHNVDSFKSNHTTTFQVADLTDEGFASRGILPAGAYPKAFWIIWNKLDNEGNSQAKCMRNRLVRFPWIHRQAYICQSMRCSYAYSIADNNRSFLVHPKINDETELLLVWDGIKTSFADGDQVPFTEAAAEASAHFVSAQFAMYVD